MTPDAFRSLALSFPNTREAAVLGSQEFRVKDRAFATLGWPQAGLAVVRLSPDDQSRFMAQARGLSPEPGGRGKRGVTRLRLAELDAPTLAPILKAAWQAVADGPANRTGSVSA